MRSLLVTLLLVIAIILLYEATIGGDRGAGRIVQERGRRVHVEVGGINP